MHAKYASLFVAGLCLACCFFAHAGNDDLKQLISEKKFTEAYKTALVRMANEAGDPQFDFLLGISALETGNFPEAIFALERVSMLHPDNVRARFELGRAYYKLRHYDLARQTLEIVLANSPDDSLKNWTKHYLSLIETGKKLQQPLHGRLHVSLAPGYSTNINTGPDLDFLLIPVPNGDRPAEVPVKVPDGFVHGDLSGEIRYRWNDRAQLRSKLWANYRKNFSGPNFDYQMMGLDTGVELVKQKWRFGALVDGNVLFINYRVYRWILEGGGEIGLDINPENSVKLSGLFNFNYFPSVPSLNAMNLKLNLGWEGRYKSLQWSVDLYGNFVFPIFDEQAYLSKNFFGGKLVGIYHIDRTQEFVAAVMAERAIYKDVNVQYTLQRADWMLNAFIAWRWNFASDFSVQPSYSLVKTFSNIIEYEHIRHELMAAVSWDFSL